MMNSKRQARKAKRHAPGKCVVKTPEELAKLRNEVDSIRISDPAPPPAMVAISHERITSFESRRLIEEDIMQSLTDNHVHGIVICGPGGVGKTTMARRIEDRVRGEKLFDEVVKVVVSQQVDLLRIQKEIAEFLDLELSGHNLSCRARRLHPRLTDSKRRLIILDDVWKRLNLRELGIPIQSVKCKIILTSRVGDACDEAHKIIPMKVLTEEEAWTLFKEKAGSCVEGSELRPIAEAVVKECKGLPIAIVTVGEALKGQSNAKVWKDARSQLESHIPIDFPDVMGDVYKPLKLTYDFLEADCLELQSLFLLCCLFPEDSNISIEQLALYGIGLDLFPSIKNIEEVRIKTHSLVEKLQGLFLLMSSRSADYVKMHDVVRDVAIVIGSKAKQGFLKSLEVSSIDSSRENLSSKCEWMSVDLSIKNAKLPFGSDFQSLRLLMMADTTYRKSSQVFDANVICFKGIKELNVLNVAEINLQPPPSTLNSLENLRTLHLASCTVKDVSIVGELTSLEILCIIWCDGIKELSADIGRLTCLRLLEVRNCDRLKRIKAGVISCLVRLEELKIVGSFDKWEGKGSQRVERNAGLSELESLPNLTSLEIEISDCNLVAEKIRLSQQLVRYRIRFGPNDPKLNNMNNERSMGFKDLPRDVKVEWIRQVVSSIESLVIDGDGSNVFNLAETQTLRNLMITNCSTLKKLVNTDYSNCFQQLQQLEMRRLPMLKYLWNQNVTPSNLKCITISECPNLRYLFSVATTSIVQIEQLTIEYCERIKRVLESNTDDSVTIEFPKLKLLKLVALPNLAAFLHVGVEIIEVPKLTHLCISDCPKLGTQIGKCPNLGTKERRNLF